MIQRKKNGGVVFTLIGQLNTRSLGELDTLLASEATQLCVTLDLKSLTQVDRDAVQFLERSESDSVQLRNCPPYVREWINRERSIAGHCSKATAPRRSAGTKHKSRSSK
jgi:hypothetical protein